MDKTKLKKEQIRVTQSACKRFELIVKDIKIPKLKYLHRSLDFKSNIHFQENEGKIYKYQKYKRGSVVMVNFGTNIGYELSGNHFAIVLNKDDNNKNGLLTVIPLTSKCKPQYLELNDSILDLVLNAQNKYLKMLTDSQKTYSQHKKELLETLETAQIHMKKIEELMSEDDYISKYSEILDKMFKETNEYITQLEELNSITDKESKEIDENMKKIFLVLEKYNTKNKTSYAMIRNITTISKLKVLKPINKFDPIGKMYISDDSLNKIDEKIREIFTFCDIQSIDEQTSDSI